jgi:hypothetical protein
MTTASLQMWARGLQAQAMGQSPGAISITTATSILLCSAAMAGSSSIAMFVPKPPIIPICPRRPKP